jgi:hypothetical protein
VELYGFITNKNACSLSITTQRMISSTSDMNVVFIIRLHANSSPHPCPHRRTNHITTCELSLKRKYSDTHQKIVLMSLNKLKHILSGIPQYFDAIIFRYSRNVFARSNTGIVGSNPNPGMSACVYFVFVLFVYVVLYRQWRCDGLRSPDFCP